MEKKKPPCLQGCHLWLKSDKMIQESLKTTIREKALAENFTNQLRQNHFLLGRHYAHLILAEMDYPYKTIEKKKDGSPLWQKGIKGSISHCKGKLAICISDSDSVQSVGIDIENCSRKINQSILKKISHLQELQQSNNFENCSPKNTLFIFCLKEAVLKCFRSLGEKIELQDIVITSLKPPLISIPSLKLKNKEAHLFQTDGFVLAGFIL